MTKINLEVSKKSRHQITQEWLDNCALEGIFPTPETIAELESFNSSNLTTEQFRTYLINKYSAKK